MPHCGNYFFNNRVKVEHGTVIHHSCSSNYEGLPCLTELKTRVARTGEETKIGVPNFEAIVNNSKRIFTPKQWLKRTTQYAKKIQTEIA